MPCIPAWLHKSLDSARLCAKYREAAGRSFVAVLEQNPVCQDDVDAGAKNSPLARVLQRCLGFVTAMTIRTRTFGRARVGWRKATPHGCDREKQMWAD
jgi:hypothetical protein